jgi:hypothetical protein
MKLHFIEVLRGKGRRLSEQLEELFPREARGLEDLMECSSLERARMKWNDDEFKTLGMFINAMRAGSAHQKKART